MIAFYALPSYGGKALPIFRKVFKTTKISKNSAKERKKWITRILILPAMLPQA